MRHIYVCGGGECDVWGATLTVQCRQFLFGIHRLRRWQICNSNSFMQLYDALKGHTTGCFLPIGQSVLLP